MELTISQGKPGDRFKTDEKFVSEQQELEFCEITGNNLPIFLSDEAAQAKGWKKRLVPGVFTLSCTIGLMEQAGLLDDVIAFMAVDKLRYLAPVYIGDPNRIGINDLTRPDYGDPIEIKEDEIPIFWACGVTPQAVVLRAKPPLMITQSPGYMFITDLLDEEFSVL